MLPLADRRFAVVFNAIRQREPDAAAMIRNYGRRVRHAMRIRCDTNSALLLPVAPFVGASTANIVQWSSAA